MVTKGCPLQYNCRIFRRLLRQSRQVPDLVEIVWMELFSDRVGTPGLFAIGITVLV